MAKKRRLKSKRQIEEITTWQQADSILRYAGELQLKINQAEARCNDTINEAKDDMQEEVRPAQKKLAEITERLQVFADARQKDFKNKKSKKLQFGTLGWRRSTKIKTSKDTLERIKEFFTPKKQKELIKIKESLNKKQIGQLTEEQLADAGARREEKDVFYAEPLLPEAVDYEQ